MVRIGILFHVKQYIPIVILLILASCQNRENKIANPVQYEIVDTEVLRYLDTTILAEVIGRGYEWSEGPVWIPQKNILLFSDVPTNKIYSWTQGSRSSTLWLEKSGYTGSESDREGSNGLLLDNSGDLLLCQHGDRRIAKLNADFDSPGPSYTTIVDNWEGKKFNSPNDACLINDNLYFTDPPYGLPGQENSELRELDFFGVFHSRDGKSKLLVDSLNRPNGIAATADGKYLYVANSDHESPIWVKYEIARPDSLVYIKTITEAVESSKVESGLPDGLKIHSSGAIFASGPGGIWIFNTSDQLIGKIKIKEAVSNCAFDSLYENLFVTADSLVYRIPLRK